MIAIMTPNQNLLLNALPAKITERMYPHLELISMKLGDVVYESGEPLQHVNFPTTAIVSLHCITENGASIEIAGVGNEGVVGIALLIGTNTMPSMATVHTAGFAYRLKRQLMMEEFNRGGGVVPVHCKI
jgi:hypothetical protein